MIGHSKNIFLKKHGSKKKRMKKKEMRKKLAGPAKFQPCIESFRLVAGSSKGD